MTNIFFTADTHFGHTNIIESCKRPFKSIEEHDQQLLDAINAVVQPNDHLYHLGDFALPHCWDKANAKRQAVQYYRAKIKCKHITLLMGNHDPHVSTGEPKAWMHDYFEAIHQLLNVKLHNEGVSTKFVMCHYGLASWNQSRRGSVMLHGHSHGGLTPAPMRFDVGVDVNDYKPVSLSDIMRRVGNQVYQQMVAQEIATLIDANIGDMIIKHGGLRPWPAYKYDIEGEFR